MQIYSHFLFPNRIIKQIFVINKNYFNEIENTQANKN